MSTFAVGYICREPNAGPTLVKRDVPADIKIDGPEKTSGRVMGLELGLDSCVLASSKKGIATTVTVVTRALLLGANSY